jgi:phage terminase large subunit-like protein
MHAAVEAAFARFTVVALFADPPHWQDAVDAWTRKWGERVQVKASPGHPLEWWTQRPKMMADALERFHEAVAEKRISHDGNVTLTRHMLHARRRVGRSGVTIAKEHPKSANKIDAAMASVLAYEARASAVAQGIGKIKPRSKKLYRF